jgi:predicted DNA-binding transcriptional regulator AlpA
MIGNVMQPLGPSSNSHGMGDPLLSAQHLAQYLDVPIATIYAWRYHGEGPPGFRVGRHLRYRWSDVEGWISDQLAEPHRSVG